MAKEKATEVVATEEVLAWVVKREDGIHVIDNDGIEGPVCTKKTVDGYYYLTPNAANRKFINVAKADAMPVGDKVGMIYKASRPAGSCGSSTKDPNAKLIPYMSDEDKAEYEAIVARAKEAADADKAKPLSPVEKLEAQIAKLQAKLASLNNEEEVAE